jgi:thiamine-phosphate pyrophosphorylase
LNLPRFYPVLDTGACESFGLAPVDAAAAIVAGGARILQFRHKGHYTRAMFEVAEEIARLCSDAGVLFVINDRADIARLLGAWLHLGQDDLPQRQARSIAGTVIGFSTHNEAQLRAAAGEPVDYVALGPIFGTVSKQNPDPVVGTAELRRIRRHTDRPLVAIGGITLQNAAEVLDAGADSVAVIGDLLRDPTQLGTRTKEWLQQTNR